MKSHIIATYLISSALYACFGCETDLEPPIPGMHQEHGIVGGTPTEYEKWQGVIGLVSLGPQGQSLGICSGTLIHPEVVLTAGHCVRMNGGFFSATYDHTKNPENLLVKAGAVIGMLGMKGELLSEVEAAEHHPDWQGDITIVSQQDWNSETPTKSFVDIALVHLKTPVTKYGTYCVRSDDNLQDGDTGIIVGYGLLGSNRQMSAGTHRFGETTLLDVYSDKTQNYIEIGNPSNTCQGDSGGPLFTKTEEGNWEITGVTSHGSTGMCMPKKNAFSTNVVKQYDWIQQKVQEWTGDSISDCTLKNGDGEVRGNEDPVDPVDPVDPEDPLGDEDEADLEGDGGNGNDAKHGVSRSSCSVLAPKGTHVPSVLISLISQLF